MEQPRVLNIFGCAVYAAVFYAAVLAAWLTAKYIAVWLFPVVFLATGYLVLKLIGAIAAWILRDTPE